MCCFPLKRRTPPVAASTTASRNEEPPVEELVPLPTPRPTKQRGTLRIPSFFYHTPPITPSSSSFQPDDEEDPFDKAYQSETTLAPPVSSSATLPLTPPTPQLRALLVDDNPINLDILARVLQSSQFSSTVTISSRSFTSPLEALADLTEREYDLILLDIDMPELSGVETALAIRDNVNGAIRERNQRAPIVAVTTNDSPNARIAYTRAGMRACVGKPLNVPELKAVIDEVVWGLA